jgi:hypothetical protein
METLFKKTYCDLISENRNKDFGQYELQTSYSSRLLRAMFSVMGGFALFVGMAFIISPFLNASDKIERDLVVFQPRKIEVIL